LGSIPLCAAMARDIAIVNLASGRGCALTIRVTHALDALLTAKAVLPVAAQRIATLVDGAIAVVINAIADLRARFHLAGTVRRPLSIRTCLDAHFARRVTTAATRLCLAVCARAALVGETAAVVVNTVANLSGSLDLTRAIGAPDAGDTRLNTLLAWRVRAPAGPRNRFVYLAVAIVVLVVTLLWLRVACTACAARNACGA
jgi:hypothetical protein